MERDVKVRLELTMPHGALYEGGKRLI